MFIICFLGCEVSYFITQGYHHLWPLKNWNTGLHRVAYPIISPAMSHSSSSWLGRVSFIANQKSPMIIRLACQILRTRLKGNQLGMVLKCSLKGKMQNCQLRKRRCLFSPSWIGNDIQKELNSETACLKVIASLGFREINLSWSRALFMLLFPSFLPKRWKIIRKNRYSPRGFLGPLSS